MKINGPGESSLLLLRVIGSLNRLKVPYVVVGAFAASFYGQVRASLDADAVISIGERDGTLNKLLDVLKKNQLKAVFTSGDIHDPVKGVVCIEDKFHNRVDLLTGIRGMNARVFERAVTASFMNRKMKIVCVEDFVAMKIFAGSHKDLDDVNGVLAVCRKTINLALAREVALGYGKKELAKLNAMIKASGL